MPLRYKDTFQGIYIDTVYIGKDNNFYKFVYVNNSSKFAYNGYSEKYIITKEKYINSSSHNGSAATWHNPRVWRIRNSLDLLMMHNFFKEKELKVYK